MTPWQQGWDTMRTGLAGMLEKAVHTHINETWSHDGSTNAWETSNVASQDWVSDQEELIEQLRTMPVPESPPDEAMDTLRREHAALLAGWPPHEALAGTLPVVLYFVTDADRQEFMEIVREAKPGLQVVAP